MDIGDCAENRIFKLDLGELWRYRDLLVMYIRRDIVTFINKQY